MNRTAHEQAGRAVREADRLGIGIADLDAEALRACCPEAGDDVSRFLTAESSVRSRRSPGGPAPEAVDAQIGLAEREVATGREWLAGRTEPPIYRAHREARLDAGEIR
jgi:argininosuccinate lyase